MARLLEINKKNDCEMLLILPEKACENTTSLLTNYILPLGEARNKVLVVSVFVPEKGVLKKDMFKEEWETIEEVLNTYNIKHIGVGSTHYYKWILQSKKKPAFEREIGSVKQDDDDGLNIFPILNYLALRITPSKKHLLQKSVDVMRGLLLGSFKDDREEFVNTLDITLCEDYDTAYEKLKEIIKEPVIAVDIEATGLSPYKNDLLTISFSKSETEGFSIPLHKVYTSDWERNRKLVKRFFEKFEGRVVFHNGQFDIPYLVYNLWMKSLTDTKNMIKGVNTFNIEDSMVMAYLCLNSVDRPKLGLKELAYSKYGNWDKDVDQSDLINYSFKDVGTYNTIDTCATRYSYNEYKSKLKEEDLEKVYENIYRPFIKAIIKMKMNGLTLRKEGFKEMEEELKKIYADNLEFLKSTEYVTETINILKELELEKVNKKRVNKKSIEDISVEFNPKSANHLRVLLFDVIGMRKVEVSKKTGAPSTGKDTIKELLLDYSKDSVEYTILKAIQEIGEMKTVLSTFVIGLQKAGLGTDQGFKVFGNYNITGTVSSRLSASQPNLQNTPSGSRFGKIMKSNIVANKGMIIVQADYSALEDRVGANITKDPNKLKVFTEGFDGHCLGASYYYEDELRDRGIEIDRTNPESVNKIKELAPDLRQEGKSQTFKANYGGIIEKQEQYEKMYTETLKYRDKVEAFALEHGYVVGAFGIKLRADLASIKDRRQYGATLRTLVNMTIQSYAQLMNRTIFKFQEAIEDAGLEDKVLIQNTVHDSIYTMCVPDAKVIKWVNDTLIPIMKWLPKELEEEWVVKNEAELEIGKNWKEAIGINNGASIKEIEKALNKVLDN